MAGENTKGAPARLAIFAVRSPASARTAETTVGSRTNVSVRSLASSSRAAAAATGSIIAICGSHATITAPKPLRINLAFRYAMHARGRGFSRSARYSGETVTGTTDPKRHRTIMDAACSVFSGISGRVASVAKNAGRTVRAGRRLAKIAVLRITIHRRIRRVIPCPSPTQRITRALLTLLPRSTRASGLPTARNDRHVLQAQTVRMMCPERIARCAGRLRVDAVDREMIEQRRRLQILDNHTNIVHGPSFKCVHAGRVDRRAKRVGLSLPSVGGIIAAKNMNARFERDALLKYPGRGQDIDPIPRSFLQGIAKGFGGARRRQTIAAIIRGVRINEDHIREIVPTTRIQNRLLRQVIRVIDHAFAIDDTLRADVGVRLGSLHVASRNIRRNIARIRGALNVTAGCEHEQKARRKCVEGTLHIFSYLEEILRKK